MKTCYKIFLQKSCFNSISKYVINVFINHILIEYTVG